MAKLEKYLFYIFLFLIPFQIRVFLDWGGNEWNSVFVYLGDVVFFIVVVLWIIRVGPKNVGNAVSMRGKHVHNIFLFLFLLIAVISLFFAKNLSVGVFRLVKLVEFVLLFLYVGCWKRSFQRGKYVSNILFVLIASGVLQAILAIAQFLKQSSLGIRFVEAGVFAPGAPGVATFIMENGEKIMRAYASFPHPNVLAGFLLLTIFCLYRLSIGNPKHEIRNPKQIQITKLPNIQKTILPICLFILVFGLFLTFSRTAIGVFVVVSLAMFLYWILRNKWERSHLQHRALEERPHSFQKEAKILKLFGLFLVSIIISTAILFPFLKARFFTISLEEQAIDLRFFYNKMALQMIKEKPLLGIGIGNFVPKLLPAAGTPVAEGDIGVSHSGGYEPFLRAAKKILNLGGVSDAEIPNWIYQPVHNIYLLIAVEMGIIGLLVFLGFILTMLIRPITPFTFLIVGFLILGLTDHYFWSLHGGGVIFWLVLGLSSRN